MLSTPSMSVPDVDDGLEGHGQFHPQAGAQPAFVAVQGSEVCVVEHGALS